MPGNHGEISVDEQNRVDNDNKKTGKKKKRKDDAKENGIVDDFENRNRLVLPSISKTRKRFVDKIRKKPKSPKPSSSSRSGSRKGGCFSMMRPRRTEESESSPSSPLSDPNDECFTHDMLRVMLETNDFCSNECNPHW
ncbi:hypothetical protein EUTSA_v10005106mg [Eutrema salsugineum]|uniref:Uncharacterized protein n=1 Tax=Eutrema salsugineum TaxID=72664 RepID=V4ML77_EUTSA|nr:uncharacterized protein LOC18013292 [Eutrema salsugineum]ESQ32176.1 hypothetical protein EUTSA_v10005106mg [Eutrema salsugineum]